MVDVLCRRCQRPKPFTAQFFRRARRSRSGLDTICRPCHASEQRARTARKPKHPRLSTEERFWTKVDKSGPCWLWTRSVDKDGYGNFQIKKGRVRAHRFAFYLTHGRWPHEQALHSCDTPACVNPDHLEDGDQLKNIQDCVARGRYRNPGQKGSAHPRAKSTEQDVIAWRKRHSLGEKVADIARSVGRKEGTVRHAILGRTWRHIQ